MFVQDRDEGDDDLPDLLLLFAPVGLQTRSTPPKPAQAAAEVSAPLTDLCLIADDLAPAAREAEFHTYAMRECPTRDELDNRREKARAATRTLVDLAAAKALGSRGAGLGVAVQSPAREGADDGDQGG